MEKFYFEIPSIARKDEAIDYIKEFYEYKSEINGSRGLHRYLDNYEEWLDELNKDYVREKAEEKVPARTYFLVRRSDNRIVGMANIRLCLNERLKEVGGNIGYSIRPTERKKGYNKINLYLALKICQKNGIKEALLDADKENPASWRTMESLGGVLTKEFFDDKYDKCVVKHYVIDVDKSLKENANKYEEMIYDNMKPIFVSENIKYVNLSTELIEDYLTMVNDYNVSKFISKEFIIYNRSNELSWVMDRLKNNDIVFSMLDKKTDKFIGNIELRDFHDKQAELGISITAKMQDKHYGREAIEAFLNYCFCNYDLDRIILKVFKFNERAIHVYEKSGFKKYKETEEELIMEILKERSIAVVVNNDNKNVTHEETVQAIKKAGFKNVFIQWYDRDLNPSQEERLKYIQEQGLNIIFAHLGYDFINDLWPDTEEGDKLVETYKKDLDVCKENNIPMVILHLTTHDNPPFYNEIGLKRVEKIVDYAKELGIKVAFENTKKQGYLEYIIDNIDNENVGICFDIGHYHAHFKDKFNFDKFKNKIFAVHLHDNDASWDQHLLPFEGTIDWKKAIHDLNESNYDGPITLELCYRNDYLNQMNIEEFYKKGYEVGIKLRDMFEEDK